MGCLFSCFTCCTADPVQLAKRKQQRTTSFRKIDLGVIRKIWEFLVPNGDVAQLGVKVLIRVFDDENERIKNMVQSGLSKKFHKSRPIQRTEVELTLGRAVLRLLETTNKSLHEDKMDFDVYQNLGSQYYSYGTSYEFGKAIDDVLVDIMREESAKNNTFTEKHKLIWASFCAHVTTNIDIGYTDAKKEK